MNTCEPISLHAAMIACIHQLDAFNVAEATMRGLLEHKRGYRYQILSVEVDDDSVGFEFVVEITGYTVLSVEVVSGRKDKRLEFKPLAYHTRKGGGVFGAESSCELFCSETFRHIRLEQTPEFSVADSVEMIDYLLLLMHGRLIERILPIGLIISDEAAVHNAKKYMALVRG
ncbi:hypothetical protein [Pseudomonas sp. P9(2020)]|uniref:hypothetical protein n=1 Tax=Pseudomonas sp. P9(2020) TaxID=2763316 RepID=UPI001B3357F6|nr:hypothetical protein [Pseudomonas sp. P9(2020)]MBP5947953.1 hypothetical protein [Pseudomonas sp. P9(2020)]